MTNKAKEEMTPKKKEEPKKEDATTDDFAESIVKDLDSSNLAQKEKEAAKTTEKSE
jgi:hypothetical protein